MKSLKAQKGREAWGNIWANYSVGVIFFVIFALSIVVKGTSFLSLNNIIMFFETIRLSASLRLG